MKAKPEDKTPWWFTTLPGQSRPTRRASFAVAGLLIVIALFNWWDVVRDGWWPQVVGAVAFSGMAGLFLATGVSVGRGQRDY